MNNLRLIPRKFQLGGTITDFDNLFVEYLNPLYAVNKHDTSHIFDDDHILNPIFSMPMFQNIIPKPIKFNSQTPVDKEEALQEELLTSLAEDPSLNSGFTPVRIKSGSKTTIGKHQAILMSAAHKNDLISKMLNIGLNLEGKIKYKLGSKNINSGTIDCSGFISYLYGTQGIKIPTGSWNLYEGGQNLGYNYSQAQPGDILVRRKGNGHKYGHVRMVVSNDNGILKVVESTSDRGPKGYSGVITRTYNINNITDKLKSNLGIVSRYIVSA